MRKENFKIVHIPEGVKVDVTGKKIIVEGKLGKLTREFKGKFTIERKEDVLHIGGKKTTKNDKKLINSTAAHIHNMIHGVNEGYEYKLKACSAHFPMSLSVEGKFLVVKNFLGEVEARKAKILEGVKIKVEKDVIILDSADKEKAGQTAANIETATKITYRDRRVFQDGIFITNKPGREEE